MRRLLGLIGALAFASLLATPVVSAAPGQSSWDSGTGRIFDQCTGEFIDNTFTVHVVESDSGPFHFNTHIEGIGETSGARYVGNNLDNEFFHGLPDGTFMVDLVLNIRLVAEGNLPD